jgi:hypothetical protein
MFDELDRLREAKELHDLLGHYAAAGAADRQAWHDRLADLPGLDARHLARLHGELLARGWVEQNTGAAAPAPSPGTAPGCYRVTPAGVRALKQLRHEEPHAA